jgi:DinB family protein
MDDLSYPIGRFAPPASGLDPAERERLIVQIEDTPRQLRQAVDGLTPEQVETPYRPGGWTVRQVVHHLPDSHMNSYVRFRLALTEDEPLIRPYHEDRWAELPDSRTAPLEVSLSLLDALHVRWGLVLRAITPEQWKRTLRHPEQGVVGLDRNLALYAWHGRHHVAHVTSLRARMGWE